MKKILYLVTILILISIISLVIISYTSTPKNSSDTSNITAEIGTGERVAVVGITSIENTPPSSFVAAIFSIFNQSNSKTLKWETSSYPANLGVNINLIKKVSDSPVRYDFVRQLGKNVPNTGSFEWKIGANETGKDLYVEVTCVTSTTACQVSEAPLKLN